MAQQRGQGETLIVIIERQVSKVLIVLQDIKTHDDMGSVGDYIFKNVYALYVVRLDKIVKQDLKKHQRSMQKNLVNVFKEVRNVLTDDGTCWVNLGDSYYNYRPGKGQGLPKQVSQILNKTYQICVLVEETRIEGLKEKRPYRNPMALCLCNEK